MVKGLAKRVVVVKSPDRRLFEEAIFILKEDAAGGVSAQDLVAQAKDVAQRYAFAQRRHFPRPALYALIAAAGAMAGYAAGAWL